MRNGLWITLAVLGMPVAAQAAAGVKFDTPEARVVEVVASPGQRSPMHEHKKNRVLIFLDDGHEALTDAQGHVREVRWKAGDVMWSAAGGPHSSDNIGATTYRIVEVELKNGPGMLPANDLDPVRVAPDHYKVEFENPQVRVLRARYGPREAGPEHEHILNRAMVYLTEANMKVTTPDGNVQIMRGAAGDVRMGGAAKHREENMSLLPFEVLVVEFKR
jgi:quercetin dioxygenase-like cupin family protein